MTGVRDHGQSYLIAPTDGSQEKLRNRRFIKPKEPESYELAGTPECYNSVPDIREVVNRTPVNDAKQLDDKIRAQRIRKDGRLRRLRNYLNCADTIDVPWDQNPSANTRSKRN